MTCSEKKILQVIEGALLQQGKLEHAWTLEGCVC